MTRDEFLQALHRAFAQGTFFPDPLNEDAIIVDAKDWPAVAVWLRDNPDADSKYLEFATATDYPPQRLRLTYSALSVQHGHRLSVNIDLDRQNPRIKSSASVWEGAEWNEREIFDLYGINFEDHPDMRRILMPDEWEGYPLRKDFTHPNLVHRPD